jgi:hypothetical protein
MERADQEVQRYRDACQIIQRDYQTMKDRYRHRLARRNSHIKTLQAELAAALALADQRAEAISAFVAAVGHTVIMDGPVEAAWNALIAAAPTPDADAGGAG